MIAELGHYALVLALALALIQSSSPVIGARKGDVALMKLADSTALAQFAFVVLSFGALTICYVISDFSVANVYENSHSQMPLIYKFTSVWGNHEGSMLLWVLILAIFGALVAVFGQSVRSIVLAITFVNAPIYLRLMRSQVLSIRRMRYVEAAYIAGASDFGILARHVIPNAIAPVLAQLSVNVGWSVLLTAGLSFVGAGVVALGQPTPRCSLRPARSQIP